MSNRATFATQMGAIAATVGSAVGLGNIWRFPYEAGQNGGGAFMLIYLACVVLMGIPVMVAEFVIGRSTHRNVCGALRQLSPGGKAHWFGYIGITASLMILSFYSVVCGWIVEYLVMACGGRLHGLNPDEYGTMFATFVTHPWRPVLWTVLFLLLNHLVLRRGLKRGIERVSNLLMPLLFVILVIFCIHSLLLPGAGEAVTFLMAPRLDDVTPAVALKAMGQAFFSLSLGLSCLLTYASYFKNSDSLTRNATVIALLDTLVAVLAGLMIFPAVFSHGMEPQAGPKLIFEVLPLIFNQMHLGVMWAVLLFLLLFLASITSTISMSEISIAFLTEEHNLSREAATTVNTGIAVVFGTLCALSFGPLSDLTICGKTLFDLFDFVSSNVLLPLGGIFFAVFVGWYLDRRLVRAQLGRGPVVTIVVFCMRYVAPLAIAAVFIYGLL